MSILNSVKKEDFYLQITEKNNVLSGYESLKFRHDNSHLYNNNDLFYPEHVVSVQLFPLYLKPTFCLKPNNYVSKVSQDKINGYAIVLKENIHFETFFTKEYSKSFRANIKRFVSRFETCFNAGYKMFYGSISENDYQILMHALHSMLTTRFNQRNDDNKFLKNWKHYESTTYELINNRKASLFVIYNNTVPVHVCINYHFDDILFVSIPSYDIDYAKFALGNISIYKLLEWSINNNYKMLDMAYGDLEYKRRWSTLIYAFEHHIFYTNNARQKLLARAEIGKIKFKNYLKSKNLDDKLKYLKNKYLKPKNNFIEASYTIESIEFINNNFHEIDFQTENFELSFLRKPINDFLYSNKEHVNDLKILEINYKKVYIFEGKEVVKKLTLH
ncbi:GNAT family N-acetyltransferase [Paucihalobacter ruber]|uniref:GNAT family N-acetyltransferase n=1 Tax=Paucihalobacter ruber TaxID=2567861 RepID=A0A506PJS3_9FLAO|nr:GNAT family N-acetyltransferase [Paucihalobacter ruber]TPV34053.1 GNAT family N-acetyltransferase [Paucihalobacter ruber]